MVSGVTQREVLQEPRRFFGWAINYKVPEEAEAAAIRQAAVDLLGGGFRLRDIADRWNADPGINTIFGGSWHAQTVEAILRRKTNTMGILERVLHARLLQHLDDSATRLPPREVLRQRRLEQVSMEGHYLLSQVGRCSVCGDRVVCASQGAGSRREHLYRCRAHMRRDHPLRHDGRRHASAPVQASDAAVTVEMVALVGSEAWHRLDLQQQRLLVHQNLSVSIHPVGSWPRFTIERKPA